MAADRCIDPATISLVRGHWAIERLPHPVQTLELERLLPDLRHLFYGGDRVGIVGRKLRVDPVSHLQEFLGTDQITKIGACLAGKHRITVQAKHLGPLDFGVPVGALDQSDHQSAIELASPFVDPLYNRRGTRGIRLDNHTQTFPAGKSTIRPQRVYNIQRELQPVRFFSVDVESHSGTAGKLRKRCKPRHQFRQHALPLTELIARVQCRQFD